MDEIEDTIAAAELVREMMADAANSYDNTTVEHKIVSDLVEVSGFGFGMTIDGAQYVVCVEKI